MHQTPLRSRPGRLVLGVSLPLVVLIAAAACSQRPSWVRAFPSRVVVVHRIPPDACVAYFGAGPCREHGMTVPGATDAIAGPPPESWRGLVRVPGVRP